MDDHNNYSTTQEGFLRDFFVGGGLISIKNKAELDGGVLALCT
jgi:hypothetical protein